jgi:glutathione synthase/RimK-type ligase-like ATP-grasp enzyme
MVRSSGAWQPGDLQEEAESLCIGASRALKADYLHVDLVRSQDGNDYVADVNGIPDWLDFEKTTGVDLTEQVAEYVVAWLHA